MPNSISMMN